MSLAEVLPNVRSLSRADKLRLIRLLAEDLSEVETLLEGGASYPVWSPHDAHDAAATLMKVLETDQA